MQSSQARVWVEMRNWLRSAFELERRAGWGLRLSWNSELAEIRVWVRMRSLAEARICNWTQGPHFVLKHDLHVVMRSAFKDLSSIIFRQPTTSYRRNLVSWSWWTGQEGVTAGQPAPQDKLGPRWTDPLQSKFQDLDMQVQRSQKATQWVLKWVPSRVHKQTHVYR